MVGMPDIALIALLVAGLAGLLAVDLRLFARGREPGVRESVVWSVGWLAVALVATFGVLAAEDGGAAGEYVSVYLIERALSLDNLFVFLLLFSSFAVPVEHRPRLLFWGIAAALAVRGLAIVGGTALVERFSFVLYVLGGLLLVLAVRMLRGVDDHGDPERNVLVRAVRRVWPVDAETRHGRLLTRRDGRRHATPLLLCLVAIVAADIAFAVDSIPAAFAVTREPLLIWLANAFALLGLRPLFVLLEVLVARFRYMDETIALVLAFVAVKLLTEDLVHLGPAVSLAGVLGILTGGLLLSLAVDRRRGGPGAAGRPREGEAVA
jgi:tellurite resistance protein TerC